MGSKRGGWMGAFALLAGCSFDPSGLGGEADHDGAVIDGARRDAIELDAASRPPCPVGDDLVACYLFEGDAADATVNGNHAVASGVTFVAGRAGRGTAIAFSPTASVVVPDSPTLDVTTAITLEAWLLPASLPALGARMAVLDNNGQYGMFVAPDGAIRCSVGSTTAIGLTVVPGTWTHLACTYDGAIIRMYQDGEPGPTINSTGPVPTAPVDGLGLGQNLPSPPADHLDGVVDDLRIWRIARTADEICVAADACP